MDNNSYTRSAQNVLQIAQEQAHYFKHQAVGTEHLLLALSMVSNSIAGRVLNQFNVTSDDIREEIESLTGYGTMQEADRDTYLPDSPKLRSILLMAKQMAQRLQAPQIGTEHLLLALLSDDACLLYTSPSPRDATLSRMPSSA